MIVTGVMLWFKLNDTVCHTSMWVVPSFLLHYFRNYAGIANGLKPSPSIGCVVPDSLFKIF